MVSCALWNRKLFFIVHTNTVKLHNIVTSRTKESLPTKVVTCALRNWKLFFIAHTNTVKLHKEWFLIQRRVCLWFVSKSGKLCVTNYKAIRPIIIYDKLLLYVIVLLYDNTNTVKSFKTEISHTKEGLSLIVVTLVKPSGD